MKIASLFIYRFKDPELQNEAEPLNNFFLQTMILGNFALRCTKTPLSFLN
jgi:hypothetical protein